MKCCLDFEKVPKSYFPGKVFVIKQHEKGFKYFEWVILLWNFKTNCVATNNLQNLHLDYYVAWRALLLIIKNGKKKSKNTAISCT